MRLGTQGSGIVTVMVATLEAEIRRIAVQGQPRQKVREISSQLIKVWCCGFAESVNRRIMVQADPMNDSF
jgi:hypothetical protein